MFVNGGEALLNLLLSTLLLTNQLEIHNKNNSEQKKWLKNQTRCLP